MKLRKAVKATTNSPLSMLLVLMGTLSDGGKMLQFLRKQAFYAVLV